jgi:guanylate kinase
MKYEQLLEGINMSNNTENKPNLIVLAGPTAVGKGSVSRMLIQRHPEVYLSISATTRHPREGEQDGVHYHFIDTTKFEDSINKGEFLEWAVVHGLNLYGTLKQPILEATSDGRPALLEIDLQGARKVREILNADPDSELRPLFVFLAPPTFEELITRLGIRGTESREERDRRLETAREELAAQSEFDTVIINDVLEDAVSQLANLVI